MMLLTSLVFLQKGLATSEEKKLNNPNLQKLVNDIMMQQQIQKANSEKNKKIHLMNLIVSFITCYEEIMQKLLLDKKNEKLKTFNECHEFINQIINQLYKSTNYPERFKYEDLIKSLDNFDKVALKTSKSFKYKDLLLEIIDIFNNLIFTNNIIMDCEFAKEINKIENKKYTVAKFLKKYLIDKREVKKYIEDLNTEIDEFKLAFDNFYEKSIINIKNIKNRFIEKIIAKIRFKLVNFNVKFFAEISECDIKNKTDYFIKNVIYYIREKTSLVTAFRKITKYKSKIKSLDIKRIFSYEEKLFLKLELKFATAIKNKIKNNEINFYKRFLEILNEKMKKIMKESTNKFKIQILKDKNEVNIYFEKEDIIDNLNGLYECYRYFQNYTKFEDQLKVNIEKDVTEIKTFLKKFVVWNEELDKLKDNSIESIQESKETFYKIYEETDSIVTKCKEFSIFNTEKYIINLELISYLEQKINNKPFTYNCFENADVEAYRIEYMISNEHIMNVREEIKNKIILKMKKFHKDIEERTKFFEHLGIQRAKELICFLFEEILFYRNNSEIIYKKYFAFFEEDKINNILNVNIFLDKKSLKKSQTFINLEAQISQNFILNSEIKIEESFKQVIDELIKSKELNEELLNSRKKLALLLDSCFD